MVGNDSLTTTIINSIVVFHEIVGTNSRLTNILEFQISEPNLKCIREIIQSKTSIGHKIKVPKKDLDTVRKKLLKHLPNLKIIIYLVDED